jgi:hypothetical protein
MVHVEIHVAKSDQLNATTCSAGRASSPSPAFAERRSDQPVAVNYEGDAGKPYKPCKSMRRVMVHCWGKDAAHTSGGRWSFTAIPRCSSAG